MDTVVPPSKSMPNVKPLMAIAAIAIATITPVTMNQTFRCPTTSNAPVPV